ncbi:hypothetical protein [Streptomyces agglomeratus]|uniref:hypothetical protein n=1 Tax=Streptomyces agglomeratus TaxID=285458 RepID=UPI0008544D29|nr:hypothetical protein [Streptomyces agglomeratus]OEJ51985.1 hypothetical protein BGK72_15610 [Streptomyces agglomeratus]
MHRQPPPTITLGSLAPHIPADLYQQAEGRPIVVVHTTARPRRPARDYVLPLALGLAGAIGILGTVAAALALFEFAVRTAALVGGIAGPIGLGLTFKLARPKK